MNNAHQQTGKYMNQQQTTINQQLNSLLLFQQSFISLVHQQIYHSNSPFQETVLKFQITHISDKNHEFNQMIAALSQQLIQKKTQYNSELKDKFQKLFEAEYLPLMRINRYQVTKVSLFGFDIYVEPLQAFLNIISRIDSLRQKIQQSNIQLSDRENAESALEKGWDHYILYSICWKMGFNLYLLKEYLTVGSKSFLRRDREILFTGISQLYSGLVPILKERKWTKLLNQFAQLNNALYQFHPSFNYFHFYSLLLPATDQLQPVFSNMKSIAEKCMRTNILTPFLFGILRSHKEFLVFIHETDSSIWLPYLNTIISSIAINLKFRILQYEQILELFQVAALKAGLLGTIRTAQVLGTLEEGWKDAKDFFISACKIGFSSGDVETWKTVSFEDIGTRIIGSLLDGMILGMQDNEQSIRQYLHNSLDRLDLAIKQISHNKIDLYFIKNTIYQLENSISQEKEVFALIRIVNLVKINSLANQYSLNFIISCFNKMVFKPGRVLTSRLAQAADRVNQMIFGLSSGNANFTFLKDKIVEFHKWFPPASNFINLLSLYSSCFQPKKCLTSLLALKIDQSKYDQFFLLVLSKYVGKPSKKQIVIKTFDKEYITNSSYVNLSYQTHCLINLLTQSLTKADPQAQKAIRILTKVCPWLIFALLNFPISTDNQLFSFSTWLIQHEQFHKLFEDIIGLSKGKIVSEKGEDLIEILLYPSMLDHLCKRINQTTESQSIRSLADLAFILAINTRDNTPFLADLVAIYFFMLSTTQSPNDISQIVNTIAILATAIFKDKLRLWMMSLLSRRIEGKSHLSITYRKKTLKTNNANVYFLGQTLSKQEQSLTYLSQQQLKECLTKSVPQDQTQRSFQFQSALSVLNSVKFKQFDKSDTQYLEDINLFDIPTLPITILKQLFKAKKDVALSILSLNLQNFTNCIQIAIEPKNIDYLCRQRFDKNITKYIPKLLLLQTITNVQIMARMSQQLSINQKVTISQNYFLQPSVLESYCQHQTGIEYLCLNNNNWRIVSDYYIKLFAISNLPSLISQYHQFINITDKQNLQYQNTINKYANHFAHFISFICFKINSVIQLSTSKQELNLRSANQLSSLNMTLSSLHLKEILLNLSLLNRTLIDRKIAPLVKWAETTTKLNLVINSRYQGNILMTNFLNGFYFTNQTVYLRHKIEIGIMLQQYYQHLRTTDSFRYNISSSIKQLPLVQFTKAASDGDYFVISKQGLSKDQIHKKYFQAIKQLQNKNALKRLGKSIYLNLASKNNDKEMYELGCYHALVQKQVKVELGGLLHYAGERKVIQWQVLKQINLQGYSHIVSVLADSQISKRNLVFVYKGEALILNGQGVRVNQYNKLDYCNRLGLRLIGEQALRHLKQFMRGFYYQKQV